MSTKSMVIALFASTGLLWYLGKKVKVKPLDGDYSSGNYISTGSWCCQQCKHGLPCAGRK